MAFWGVENVLYGVWHQKHCETEFYQTKHVFSNVHWWTRSHNNLLVTPFLHLVHQCTLKKLWQIWSLEYTCHSWWPPRGWASCCPWGCPRSYFLHDSYLLHYNKSIGIQVLTIWPYILHPEICHITGSICGWDLGQPHTGGQLYPGIWGSSPHSPPYLWRITCAAGLWNMPPFSR